jgi:hypothetical protein
MENSMSLNESKMVSKFETHHLLRLPSSILHQTQSPHDFWLFGMLKVVLKDGHVNSNDEIEEAIGPPRNKPALDNVPRVFRNWMSHLASIIKNGGENTCE